MADERLRNSIKLIAYADLQLLKAIVVMQQTNTQGYW
jgi:hypothetical protein